eukprot:scaffold23767_cov62-Phaeocystis_antarctica.AAC.3
MMRRHFRVPPATTNTTANANADGARTGSKSQQDTFDDYLYLTQLQQARLPRPCPILPDLARLPPSPATLSRPRPSLESRRAASRPPSMLLTTYYSLTTGALLRDRLHALAAAALGPGQHYGYPLLAAQ